MNEPSVLIAGCGFLGVAAARLFHERGWRVVGLTHSSETAARLNSEPYTVAACDIADPSSLAELRARHGNFQIVVHCASSGRGDVDDYRRVYFRGAENLIASFGPEFTIFTSSTSVYAELDGDWVTEESPAEPQRETGRILRETEDLVLSHGGAALRLSALYGAGRSVLLRKFFAAEAVIEGDGGRWVNQIHRDDAAAAILVIAERKRSGVFNVTDSAPLSQLEVYTYLADRFTRPLPPTGEPNPNRKRGVSNKRVSNQRLRELGWVPRYEKFFTAVEHDATLAQP